MTERYSFAVDRHLVEGSVVWSQDNIDIVNSTLADTMTEGYITAEEDSSTRYLSVLDSTSEISLENLNITLSNPKLEVEDGVEHYTTEEILEQPEDANDQVVVFSVEGSDELYGIQILQDEDGNMQKYQFQFRKNEDGQLEAIPETVTLIPMDEPAPEEEYHEPEGEYTEPEEEVNAVQIFVQEDNSGEHILPDHLEQEPNEDLADEEEGVMYEPDEMEEVDIKPGVLQLQNVKQEMQESHLEYENNADEETFPENRQISDFEAFSENTQEQPESNFDYQQQDAEQLPQREDETPVEYQEKEPEEAEQNMETSIDSQDFEHVEVSPDLDTVQTVTNLEENEDFINENAINDSDENDYEIVEGLHITGDVETDEQVEKQAHSNILKHALKMNKESPKIVKKDNRLYLYVVQHPEKENVDSLSYEMSNLCKSKVNPRSILKSSHAMFQAKNENESQPQDERLNKRFARCKEAVQAMIFHNFINKTTIPQAPVRKNRLPRKQKIKPVERMDEEIVVQEVMVSSNGFVETVSGGVNKENQAVTEYVELTDSDDDYDPKKVHRKKKKHRRKRIEITISDDSDASDDSVIELDESDDDDDDDEEVFAEEEKKIAENNNTPPKRRRGRPPKNRSDESPATTATESPPKKSRVEPNECPTKPEIPCPKCNKTFPSENSLKTHLQHHSLQNSIKRALPEYKYKCGKCETTFINNILLKKHMCSKLFSCTVCSKKFPDLSSLNGHKRNHAKELMVRNTTEVAQLSPKRMKPVQPNVFKVPKSANFKCRTCNKLCSSMQNLNLHMKTHREFICGTCSKNFPSQLLLERHVRQNCVKSPQLTRRSTRLKSAGDSKRKSPVLPRLRTRSAASPGKRSPSTRLNCLRVKCDKCAMVFNSHQALFKHKVLRHGLETPDKSVLEQTESKKENGGVPAAKRLQNVYAGLKCQLDFNE